MNVILFTTSLEDSAVTTQLLEFAEYLYQKNHSVVVVCHEYISEEAQREYQKFPFMITSLLCHRWQICKGVSAFRALRKQCKADIVHCHLGRAYIIGILSKHKRMKLLATFHNLKNYLNFVTRLFIGLFYKKFDGITAVSSTALASYRFSRSMYRTRPVRTIYNPVFTTHKTSNNEYASSLQLFQHHFFTIGTINRFVKGKGYDLWFELVKKMSLQGTMSFQETVVSPAFWTAGTGVLEQEFKEKVVQDNIPHVAFLGYRRDISTLIRQSQLIVYPTINEGFGLVLYEALIAGVPVLVNPLAVFKEIVGEHSMWFVNFSNVAEVQEKIYYFAQHYTDIQEQARKEGERYKKLFVPSNIFDQYISFYKDCCIS